MKAGRSRSTTEDLVSRAKGCGVGGVVAHSSVSTHVTNCVLVLRSRGGRSSMRQLGLTSHVARIRGTGGLCLSLSARHNVIGRRGNLSTADLRGGYGKLLGRLCSLMGSVFFCCSGRLFVTFTSRLGTITRSCRLIVGGHGTSTGHGGGREGNLGLLPIVGGWNTTVG